MLVSTVGLCYFPSYDGHYYDIIDLLWCLVYDTVDLIIPCKMSGE
jgi:hypothetical protein